MIKKFVIVLFISLLAISVYAQEDMIKKYELNTYDVGVKKEIGHRDLLMIEYTNVPISKDVMSIVGKVTIPPKYEVWSLTVDYYITDKAQEETYIVVLDLKKGAVPNTFTFDKHYPLDLTKYEFELMVIEFMNEIRDTQEI